MKVFEQTSAEPYNRHTYEIVLKSGKKISFSFWEQVQEFWFLNSQMPDYLDTVIVKDKKNLKSSGFGS